MYNEQHIEQTLKDHIKTEFMRDQSGVVLDNNLPLIRGGIIDSLGIFTLISFIEQQFGVKVQPDDVVLENFETVTAINNLVMARLKASASS